MRSYTPLYRFICAGSIATGLLISGYLFFNYSLRPGTDAPGAIDYCNALFGRGCLAALKSPVSRQLGLPLAGWGIIYYTSLACILLLYRLLRKAFQGEAIAAAATLLSLMGAVLSLIIVAMVLKNPQLFCPLCMIVHLSNLVIAFCFWKIYGPGLRKMMTQLGATGITKFMRETNRMVFVCNVLAFAVTGLLPLVFYLGLRNRIGHYAVGSTAFHPQTVLKTFEAEKKEKIPIDERDPVMGPENSPVEMIVFSDFECPACRRFGDQVITVLNLRYKGKYHLIFKHFPLGTACNAFINTDLHPRACDAAFASEAANQQGRFWDFHDVLFKTDLNDPKNTLSSIAIKLGLDLRKFELARNGDSAKERVKESIALAASLGIHSTPAIFVNGRRVNTLSLEALQLLIDHELGSVQH